MVPYTTFDNNPGVAVWSLDDSSDVPPMKSQDLCDCTGLVHRQHSFFCTPPSLHRADTLPKNVFSYLLLQLQSNLRRRLPESSIQPFSF